MFVSLQSEDMLKVKFSHNTINTDMLRHEYKTK